MITLLASLALCAPLGQSPQSAAIPLVQERGARSVLLLEGRVLHSASDPIRKPRAIQFEAGADESCVLLWEEVPGHGPIRSMYRIQRADGRWSRPRAANHTLHLRAGDVDPLESSIGSIFGKSREEPASTGGHLSIIQYTTPPIAAYSRALTELGVIPLRFLAGQAHIAVAPPETWDELRALPFIRWVGAYDERMRIEPALLGHLRDETALGPMRFVIQLTERSAQVRKLVAGRIAEAGGQLHPSAEQGLMLEATMDAPLLRSLITWDEVLYVDRWTPARTYMDKVRVDGGADFLEALTGFTGQGVAGEVLDSGLLTSHIDFQSNPPMIHNGNGSSQSHGTSVAGIVFGDGTGSTNARGMLPDGTHVFSSFANLGNRFTHTAELLAPPYECVFQTNSWGWGYGAYTNKTTQFDDVAFQYDLVICQAQGNSGSSSSEQLSWAKNVLSVGAVRHQNTQTLTDDAHNGIAGSHGPAPDGRIKPDLCFWYDSIRTTASTGGYDSNFGGTSAATPCTAGHVGLMEQMWHMGLFGAGGASTVFDSAPKATTAKALMINTADQYSFSSGSDLRRVRQGWGRPDVERLYDMRDQLFIVDESDVLQNLDTISYPINVAAGTPELRATMVFLDPPGTTSSSQHRINDLSLRLISPSGVKYWGNRSMKTSMYTASGGSSNTLDTVENVWLQNPEAGIWTVKIFADEVNQDGHTETAAVDADFALVVSGVTASTCADPINYCSTSANSMGAGAVMGFVGSASLIANNLTLATSGLPAGTFGLYLFGPAKATLPAGNGTLCVAQPFSLLSVITSDPSGNSSYALDLQNLPGTVLQTGDTLHFQLWYRDRNGGGAGNNLSDGLEVTFCD